jgi:hypothetical protein
MRWLKLGTVTYPTSLLSNSLYTVLRITFIQNIIANEEYTMTVLFKFSNLALTGFGTTPMYGNCEQYIYTKSATSENYPRISLSGKYSRIKYLLGAVYGYGYWR